MEIGSQGGGRLGIVSAREREREDNTWSEGLSPDARWAIPGGVCGVCGAGAGAGGSEDHLPAIAPKP